MSKIRLTDLSVRSLKSDTQKLFIDATLPNFGVRVSPGGTKTFTVILPDRRYKALGRYPQLSLRDARTAAKRILAAPPSTQGDMALTDALREWFFDCERRLRPATVSRYRFAMKHVTGATVATLTTSSTDPHVIAAVKVFLNWCVEHGITDRNPYAHRKVSYTQRDRVLTDDEVHALWAYDFPPYSTIVKLLLLTGQRRQQFASFQTDWIDGDTIHFPASIMKSKRPHTIPLTDHVRTLVADIRPFNGWSKAKTRIDTYTGVTGWVLHDLRRYYSTTMAKLGVPLHITEHLLDHRSTVSGVAAVYNRYGFLPEMRQAVSTYEQHIATITRSKGA